MGWNSTSGKMRGPLNIDDIAKALDYPSGDLAGCIKFGTVNKWAKWKPQSSPVLGEIPVDQRMQGNWGFDVNETSTNSIRFASLTDALNQAVAKSGDWTYIQPGSKPTDKFRMFDFLNTADGHDDHDGYNINATAPYTCTVPTTDSSTTVATSDQTFTIARPSTAELSLADFRISSSDLVGRMYFAIIYRKWNGTSLTGDVVCILTDKKVSDLASGQSFTKTVTFREGTYKGCVVLVEILEGENSFSEGNSVIYLPNSLFTFTHTQIPIYVAATLSWQNGQGTPEYYDTSDDYYVLMDGILKVTFANNQVPAGTQYQMPTSGQPFQVNYRLYNDSMPVSDEITYTTSDFAIPSSSQDPFTIDFSEDGTVPNREIHVYEGQTANKVRITVETTGAANANGERATIYLASSGESHSTCLLDTELI